jgi:CTP:molybdopterin cytidylyltransferase MocA
MVDRPAEVVLLAAGRSSRMGEPKGLVQVAGRPWIEHQLRSLADRRAIVVLGDDRERYLAAIPSLAQRVVVAVNPDPGRGPFSSLQVGLACVSPETPAFVLPIDVPAAFPRVWSRLEEALGEDWAAAVPTCGDDDRGGHPVLLSSRFLATLLGRPATGRLDHELAARARGEARDPGSARAQGVLRVPVDDPRVRLNLNAPEDWAKLVPGQ